MSSILTNPSAITALATLRTISANLIETEERVSTGLKVSKASDNASYWAISNNLKSDSKVMGSVADALGLGIAALDTATNGVEQVLKVLGDIRQDLISAKAPAADKGKINTDLDALKERLKQITYGSNFNGDNYLYNTLGNAVAIATPNKSIISSVFRNSAGALTVNTISVNVANLTLIDTTIANRGLLTKSTEVNPLIDPNSTSTATTTAAYFLLSGLSSTTAAQINAGYVPQELKLTAATTDSQLDGMMKAVDAMITGAQNMGTTLGALNNGAQIQQEFIKTLQSATTKGISALIDADMNEESTRLKALQTQQQLGLQALSIANSEAEKLLTLFR